MWMLTVLSSGLLLLQPWPVQILVDHVLGGKPAPGWLESTLSHLPSADTPVALAAWVAFATLLLFILYSIVDVSLTVAWLRVAQRAVYRLAGDVFARLQRRSPAFHATVPVGDSLCRITRDSWCLYNAVGALFFTPLHAMLVGGVMIYVLLMMNPFLTLIALAAAPLLAVSSLTLGRHAERAKGVERQLQGQIESHLQQTLAGIRIVQTSVQEEREHTRFTTLAGSAITAHRRTALVAALSSGSAGLVTALGSGAVLGLGAFEVLANRLSLGQLLVFLAYLGTLNGQLIRLATAYTTTRGLAPSIDRIAEVIDAPIDVRSSPGARRLSVDKARLAISLEDVCFEYLPGRPVLRGISLDIPAGTTVAVVGASGSGKSTLAALLPRLMDVTGGRITVDGQDIRDLDLASWRDAVAIAFQEPMLFADTLAANIALGRPGARREQIQAAASAAGLDDVIARLPEGLDAVLGESGSTLSGGEQQRISIARALLKDAPILILDEPTSALDAEIEERLIESLQRLRHSRTTILIAHRLSTIRNADLIAVLESGFLVEAGSHDELIGRGGRYAALLATQRVALQGSRTPEVVA